MIDEKKLIEEITAFGERMTQNGMQGDFHLKIINAVIDIIGEQPKVGEWIPVSERLPEEDGSYLAWIRYERREFVTIEEFDTITKWDFHTFNPNDKVIAWMPLPEPYKGELANEA